MKNYLYHSLTLLLVTSLTTLSSCSSKPSESMAREDLNERIDTESDGRLELISFEKTNAVDREFMGQKSYVIEFKAKLRVIEDCFMYVNNSGVGSYFKSFTTFENEPDYFGGLTMRSVKAEKGTEVNFSDVITYAETEEGWKKVKKSIFE